MFDDPRFHRYAMAPAMKGSIDVIAASVMLSVSDSKLSLGGMVLGAPTVIGLSVSGASLASELIHDFILAKIKPPWPISRPKPWHRLSLWSRRSAPHT